ncbi:hypothetical protein BCV72DRAFT_208989, partial [Rhizopus microsporus var. microsporus]
IDAISRSTDYNDLYGFLIQADGLKLYEKKEFFNDYLNRHHPNLKKIIIDNISSSSVIHVYDHNELLNEPETNIETAQMYPSFIYWLEYCYLHSFQNLSQKQDIDGT